VIVKVLMLAEVEVNKPAEVQGRLDAFREATLPGQEWGVHLSRAQAADVREFLPQDLNELLEMDGHMLISPIQMGPDYKL
jgi:hypothetical protein